MCYLFIEFILYLMFKTYKKIRSGAMEVLIPKGSVESKLFLNKMT